MKNKSTYHFSNDLKSCDKLEAIQEQTVVKIGIYVSSVLLLLMKKMLQNQRIRYTKHFGTFQMSMYMFISAVCSLDNNQSIEMNNISQLIVSDNQNKNHWMT